MGIAPTVEIEIPPEGDFNRGSYGVASDAEVRSALTTALQGRLHEHQTSMLYALTAFKAGTERHILALDDGTADVDFGPVVSALGTALKMVFPEAKVLETMKGVLEIDSTMLHEYHSWADHVSAAKSRLTTSVDALIQSYTTKSVHAWDDSKKKLSDLVEDVLSDLDDKTMTTNPTFIDAVCDHAGIPAATAQLYDSVRQQLEMEFFGLYERVRAELQSAHPQPGGMVANPNQWEHDAIEEEKKLYKEEGEQAWEDAYKE